MLYGRPDYLGYEATIKEQKVRGMKDYSQCTVRSAGFTKKNLVIIYVIMEF
jgi:hypothetical protein